MFNRKAPVSQAMTPKVKCVRPDTTMDQVVDIFETHNFHHLPVTDTDGKVLGIISSTDWHKLEDHFTLFKSRDATTLNQKIMRSLLAKEVMTKHVAAVHADDSLEYAVDIFRENLFHALPVVDKEKKLIGILTPFDLMVWAFRQEPLGVE